MRWLVWSLDLFVGGFLYFCICLFVWGSSREGGRGGEGIGGEYYLRKKSFFER